MTVPKTQLEVPNWATNQALVESFIPQNLTGSETINFSSIPASGIYRAVLKLNGMNNQELNYILHGVYHDGDAVTSADPVDLIATIVGWLGSAWATIAPLVRSIVSLAEVVVYVYDIYEKAWVNVGSNVIVGAGTSVGTNGLPQQVALKVKTSTVIPGVRGGLFVTGLTTDGCDPYGIATAQEVSDVADYGLALYSPYTLGAVSLYPGIFSTVLGTLALAKTIIVNGVYDNVRRRKEGVGN